MVERLNRERGERETEYAREALAEASVPFHLQIIVGEDPVTAIVQASQKLNCGLIVLGTRGMGAIAGLVPRICRIQGAPSCGPSSHDSEVTHARIHQRRVTGTNRPIVGAVLGSSQWQVMAGSGNSRPISIAAIGEIHSINQWQQWSAMLHRRDPANYGRSPLSKIE